MHETIVDSYYFDKRCIFLANSRPSDIPFIHIVPFNARRLCQERFPVAIGLSKPWQIGRPNDISGITDIRRGRSRRVLDKGISEREGSDGAGGETATFRCFNGSLLSITIGFTDERVACTVCAHGQMRMTSSPHTPHGLFGARFRFHRYLRWTRRDKELRGLIHRERTIIGVAMVTERMGNPSRDRRSVIDFPSRVPPATFFFSFFFPAPADTTNRPCSNSTCARVSCHG